MAPGNIHDPSFKAARKKQWRLGAGFGGEGSQTFLSYIWGVENFFSKGIVGGGGSSNFFAHHMKM